MHQRNFVYKLLWHLVHTVFTIFKCIHDIYLQLECKLIEWRLGNRCEAQILDNLQKATAKLKKMPKHLTILLGTEEPSHNDLAKLVLWSLTAGISFISFYDVQGKLKMNEEELKESVKRILPKTANVIWHNPECSYKNGFSGPKIHVQVLTQKDGHKALVETCKNLSKSNLEISIQAVDEDLRKQYKFPDPDLGIYFGDYFNLCGYPPWQIRLTEFLNIPSHHNLKDYKLINVLRRYNKCEQRVGK